MSLTDVLIPSTQNKDWSKLYANELHTNAFQLTTGAVAGDVIVSDASGNGSWAPSGTIPGATLTVALYNMQPLGVSNPDLPVSGSMVGVTFNTVVTSPGVNGGNFGVFPGPQQFGLVPGTYRFDCSASYSGAIDGSQNFYNCLELYNVTDSVPALVGKPAKFNNNSGGAFQTIAGNSELNGIIIIASNKTFQFQHVIGSSFPATFGATVPLVVLGPDVTQNIYASYVISKID